MTPQNNNSGSRTSGQGGVRGQSHVIGIALLAGMVLAGTVILLSTGWILLDDLEEGAQTEQTESTLEVTNDKLSTAAASGDAVSLPTSSLTQGGISVEEDTTAFEFRTEHGVCGESYSFRLNSFVYTDDDQTWVLEGGGKWGIGPDGDAWVSSPPSVGYDDGQLALDLITFNASRFDQTGDTIARGTGRPVVNRSKLTHVLSCPGGPDRNNSIRMTVNSTHIDAWDDHLRSAISGQKVTYYGPDNASTADDEIEIVIEELVKQREAAFSLDGSLSKPSMVTFDSGLTLSPTVHNTGGTNGSTPVTVMINESSDSADSYAWSQSTGDIDPGNSTTLDFDLDAAELGKIGGVDDSNRGDLEQYGTYELNVTTGNSSVEGSFHLAYADQAIHRLESISHQTGGQFVTVNATVTNVGNVSAPSPTNGSGFNDIEFSLNDQAGDVDVQNTNPVDSGPMNQSRLSIELNRSQLPYDTYDYTIDLSDNYGLCTDADPSCAQSGTFTVDSGGAGISNVDEIEVNEPSNVSVSVIGTEISWESGNRFFRNRGLAPVTATAVVGGEHYRFTQDGVRPVDDPHEGNVEADNLNTVGTRDAVYEYNTSLDSGSVTIEATFWDCHSYDYVNTDTYDGTTYYNYECGDIDKSDYTQVTVSGGGGASDNGFMMTRDEDRNELPDIDNVLPRQRTLQTVFDDGTEDIELDDGELSLGPTDFAFMMETTTTQSSIQSGFPDYEWGTVDTSNQTQMNQAAWDISRNERDDGETDPDFNDVIGFVEIDPGRTVEFDSQPIDNRAVTDLAAGTTTEFSIPDDSQTVDSESDSIDVDVDEIVIE